MRLTGHYTLCMLIFSVMILLTGCPKRPPFGQGHRIVQTAAFYRILDPNKKPVSIFATEGRKEGPSWFHGRLYFSDQNTGVYLQEDDGGFRHIALSHGIGTTPLPSGNLAVCTWWRSPFFAGILEITPDGVTVGTIADKYNGMYTGMPNDLITDRKGGLYFTEPWGGKERIGNEQPGTTVYYINPAGELLRVSEWGEHGFPNGCVLSPDDTKFYLNDSEDVYIWVYDVAADGSLSNKRRFAELELSEEEQDRGGSHTDADGMTFDVQGNLYVASNIGVQVFDSRGGLVGIIDFPAWPSHIVFGGSDMKTLYVTALGHVFSLKMMVAGYQYPLPFQR